MLKIQSGHDSVHRRTDGQGDTSIPPFQLRWSEGYNYSKDPGNYCNCREIYWLLSYNFRDGQGWSRGLIQYCTRRPTVRCRKASKPRDWVLKCWYHFEIWQAIGQHRCRDACHFSTQLSISNDRSRALDVLQVVSLQWRHNGRDGVSNHQPHDCLLNSLYRRRSKKRTKLSASLAFVRGIHRWPANSAHKWPVTRKMFPFDDVIMLCGIESPPWSCLLPSMTNAKHGRKSNLPAML